MGDGPGILLVVLFAMVPLSARAGDSAGGIVSEVRLGILDHDAQFFGGKEGGTDINGEVLFVSPISDAALIDVPPWYRWMLQPRPHIGFDANTGGYTSQLYFGVTWTAVLATELFRPEDGIFLGLGFGGALNNGHVSSADSNHRSLGSNLLFHLSAEFGYQITRRWSISLYCEHSSNAHLASRNDGLNNVGLRAGFRF